MVELDLCGLSCPLPVIKTQKAMKDHPGEELNIKVDLATARDHVKRLTSENGYDVTIEEVGKEYHIKAVPKA
jgi:tRNA 2-thiouridine synthesizing protein A